MEQFQKVKKRQETGDQRKDYNRPGHSTVEISYNVEKNPE